MNISKSESGAGFEINLEPEPGNRKKTVSSKAVSIAPVQVLYSVHRYYVGVVRVYYNGYTSESTFI